MAVPLVVHGATHPGLVHLRNEDSFAIEPGESAALLLVCDGMGGMGRGDQASRLAVEQITAAFQQSSGSPSERMTRAIAIADDTVRAQLCVGGRGYAGCTASMLVIQDNVAYVGWVGDSRVYLIRDGKVVRTKDHKLVQELVDLGQLSPEEAKRSSLSSVITRALGGRPPGTIAVAPAFLEPWTIEAGDHLLVCSDGLADLVSDEEIAEMIVGEPAHVADRLIEIACDRGGHDNITVIVVSAEAGFTGGVSAARGGAVTAVPEPENSGRTAEVSPIREASVSPYRGLTPQPAPNRSVRQWLWLPAVLGMAAYGIVQFFRRLSHH